MLYTEKILEEVRAMGSLGYSLARMIILIEPADHLQFMQDFNDTTSEIYIEYKKGIISAEYEIDKKLFENAKNGDVTAIEQLEVRRINRNLNES